MWVVVASTILAPVSATRTRTFGPCTIAPSAGVTIRIFAGLLGRVVGVVVGPPPLPVDPLPHAASSRLDASRLATNRPEASVPAAVPRLRVFTRGLLRCALIVRWIVRSRRDRKSTRLNSSHG